MRHRADKNQAEVIKAFKGAGCSVLVLSQVGKGCPDLLVGYNGFNFLVEIKNGRNKLSKSQIEFKDNWQSQIAYVWNIADVEVVIKSMMDYKLPIKPNTGIE